MRRENDIQRAILERQARGRGNLEADADLQAGPRDLSLADPDQVGRDVDADRWVDEVDPFGERDQDVPDPAAEVEHAILARDGGCAQDASVGGIDHPESASGKDVAHAEASQAAGEPLAIAVANGGLVDAASVTAHSPQPPAAPRLARPPQSPSICPTTTNVDQPGN